MLVAEVVSPSSRKRDDEAKRREYLAFGTREYWNVGFELGRVVVLVRESGQLIGSELLPSLDLRVSDLWIGVSEDTEKE